MKWVKIYEDYNEIKEICHKYRITNWTLNSDGLVDVDGEVDLSHRDLTKLPLKFGTIRGDFWCYENQLTSLEGAPRLVRGNFSCANNQLTSLEGAPRIVMGHFGCSDNKLTSFGGSPKTITGDFWCHDNQIRSFEGAPMYVDLELYCYNNPISLIWNLFLDWSKVEFLNDCDAIQDKNIIMVRLNYFLTEIGKDECNERTIKELKKRGYKIIY